MIVGYFYAPLYLNIEPLEAHPKVTHKNCLFLMEFLVHLGNWKFLTLKILFHLF